LEIIVGVPIIFAERGGSHAELIGWLEILEDLTPVALVPGATAVALVDDDEVEEVGRVFLVKPRSDLVLGSRLLEGKVHVAHLNALAGFDPREGVPEGGKRLVLRVVYKEGAVREE